MGNDRLVSLLIRWLLLALSVWVAAELVRGIHLQGVTSTLIVALILGLLNLYLRPILFILSLPLTIMTLGLFIVVLNAVLLGLTSWIAEGLDFVHFHVDSF